MYYLLFLILVCGDPGQNPKQPTKADIEFPHISPTNPYKAQRYVSFLWQLFQQGLKANPKLNNDKAAHADYVDAFQKIANVYSQISVTWEGTAAIESVKKGDGFPAESMIKVSFPVPTFLDNNGKLIPVHVPHNEWSKKIRPGTKVTAKAFIEEIRYTDGGFVIVLSHVSLVSRAP